MLTQKVSMNPEKCPKPQVSFGIAKFTKIKRRGHVDVGIIEDICKNCPGLDEFTHNHNVSLIVSNRQKYRWGTLRHKFKVVLKVVETPKSLIENFFSKTRHLKYSAEDLYFPDEIPKETVVQKVLSDLKSKFAKQFENDLTIERRKKQNKRLEKKAESNAIKLEYLNNKIKTSKSKIAKIKADADFAKLQEESMRG